MTREEYEKKIAALEPLDDEKRKSVTCALLGHSHITTQVASGMSTVHGAENKLGMFWAAVSMTHWKSV